MIRTKTLGYILSVYLLGFIAVQVIIGVVWAVLYLGAALLSCSAPDYSTASWVTALLGLVYFIYADYRKTMQRRKDAAEGWTEI